MSYLDTIKKGLGETILISIFYIILIILITPYFTILGFYSFIPASLISIAIVHLVTNMIRNRISTNNNVKPPIIQQSRPHLKGTKYCVYCGNKIGRDDKYCASCGRNQL